ncbi:protein AATF/BFR2 [Sporothrix schenckii 1099-18]|uniref:Protein BFR2 n=2 Tax=Sporothrix schenckii TaxID=29908 RepID=U7PWK8_SPOS1|nr:protein AATF/BFR2 [Sporothrix schenckii 1099-18]ERS99129.1 hypothetical protein HMPREF1624_04325 [Sporothrix schenckii ATCC 58251]KJR83208.1 protein AATF/BFR2 [Sporothrix schenckii 1099-18]
MVGLKGLAAQLFAKQSLAEEFDPETEDPVDDDSDNRNGDAGSDSEVSAPEDTQDTEHYVQVGKSKLRRNEPVALGPAYRGVRVSRKQLEQDEKDDEDEGDEDDEDQSEDEDEEFDDPDAVDVAGAEEVHTDDEIDSDEAFGEDDEDIIKKFTFRGSGKPKTPKGKPVYSDEEDEEGEEEEDEDEDDEEEDADDSEGDEVEDMASSGDDDDDDDDDDGDEEEEEDNDDELDASATKAEEEARKILAEQRRQVLSSISASAKADADKGFAVRQQRRTFDALLNMRIRIQKALSTANTLHTVAQEDAASTAAADSAVEEAAAKAIELLSSIHDIRASLCDADGSSTNTKRKRRSAISTDSSCRAIFDEMTVTEEAAAAKRRKVIDRWAARIQRPSAASAAAAARRFTAGAAPQPLSTVLDGQLVAAERLVKRTRTPRSCAPVQAAKKVEEDPEIFDDADFYQLLLKELVDQRTVDGTAPGSVAPTVRWATTAAKDAKTRKQVDRKASKGRKMRYNVHAKLQNFTAPEDRRDWEPEAIDRFFSSLFGQRMALAEDDGADDDDDEEDMEMGGASVGEGLRLF